MADFIAYRIISQLQSVTPTRTNDMTPDEKYKAIVNMESIDQHTAGRYPTMAQFLKALKEGRVAGDYVNRIIMISSDPEQQYRFVKRE